MFEEILNAGSSLWDSAIGGAGPTTAGPVAQAPQAGGQDAPQQQAGGGDSSLLGQAGQTIDDLGRGLQQEGIFGLFDIGGMLDRQEAQRELAGNFKVVPDGTPGGAENQVTQEQFEKIARTYSDIRMGRSDIKFDLPAGMSDTDADAYRNGTMKDIGRILETKTGRELIGELSDNERPDGSHRTTYLEGKSSDPRNAETTGGAGAEGTDAHPGAGSDSHIHYDPGSIWLPEAGATNGEPWLPMRSDVQLYHELTHSYHQTHGTAASGKVTKESLDAAHVGEFDLSRTDIDYDVDRLEQQSVGIGEFTHEQYTENAYRAARARLGAAGGPGVVGGVGGDVGMEQRDTYSEPGFGAPVH